MPRRRPTLSAALLAALCLTAPAGAAERLTFTYLPKFFVSYAPDGSHLTYSQHHANRRGAQQVLVGLRIVRVDGRDDRPLLAAFDRDVQIQEHAAWSPDGKRLALSGGGNDTGNAAKDVFVCDIEDFHARNLRKLVPGTGTQVGEQPTWSPDGRFLAGTNIAGNTLWRRAADGSGRLTLTQQSGNYTLYPHWSPDGKRIAFVTDRDGNPEIYTVGADGHGLRRVTNHPALDSHPRWSPDGRWLAFASYRDGNSEIYLCRPDGRGLRNLTTHSAHDAHPAWSPDGRWLAFVSDRDGGFDLYRTPAPPDLAEAAAGLPEEEAPPAQKPAAGRPDGLVLHYDCDAGSGTTLADKVGPNQGTLRGVRWAKTDAGYALELDGQTTHVECGDHASLQLGGPLTLTAWVKLQEKSHNHYVLSKYGWNLYVSPERLPCFETRNAADSAWESLMGKSALKVQRWHHLAAVFDPKTREKRIYLDGELSGAVVRPDDAIGGRAGYPLELGRYGPGKSQHLYGLLDEVRVYARALSATDVKKLYEQDRKRFE